MGSVNYNKAIDLLNRWEKVNKENAKNSREKAISLKGGLDGRVKIKNGEITIYDYKTTKQQEHIQKELISILPEKYKAVIISEPAITDFNWTVKDYLELYFGHYKTVIDKLRGIVENLLCQTQS